MRIENPYHEGEIQVQTRVGVRVESESNSVVIADTIIKGAMPFIRKRNMVVLGSIDQNKHIWASVLAGQPGFMDAPDDRTLAIDLSKAGLNTHDPFWENCKTDPHIGMLVIDLGSRRRLRINGQIRSHDAQRMVISVLESYPNCPKYIQRRQILADRLAPPDAPVTVLQGDALGTDQKRLLREADTLFVASAHPTRGVDASHRGGNPGFVRVVDDRTLRIPDYSGNSMFNTLGNFVTNPQAGLIFIDFENSTTLQLIGQAEILWDADDPANETGGTKRYWDLKIDRWLETKNGPAPRGPFLDYSPFNPNPPPP